MFMDHFQITIQIGSGIRKIWASFVPILAPVNLLSHIFICNAMTFFILYPTIVTKPSCLVDILFNLLFLLAFLFTSLWENCGSISGFIWLNQWRNVMQFAAETSLCNSPEVKAEYLSCMKQLLALINYSPTISSQQSSKALMEQLEVEIKRVEYELSSAQRRPR